VSAVRGVVAATALTHELSKDRNSGLFCIASVKGLDAAALNALALPVGGAPPQQVRGEGSGLRWRSSCRSVCFFGPLTDFMGFS
jgi:hypothetical protein